MRNGSYPAYPYEPDKLSQDTWYHPTIATAYNIMYETDLVEHIYLADGWPSDGLFWFDGDNNFLFWIPVLDIENRHKKWI